MTSTMPVSVDDCVSEELVTIPAPRSRADVDDDSSSVLGRDLVVVGGQRGTGADRDGSGGRDGDAWWWTAPRD